jgi:hypothetical protein
MRFTLSGKSPPMAVNPLGLTPFEPKKTPTTGATRATITAAGF